MEKKPAVLLAACASLALAFLLEQVQATRLGYALGRARKEIHAQEQTNAHLRLRLAKMRSPDLLAREAQSRLQMTPPSPESQVYLGKSVERAGAAGALSLLLRR
ncbi:MAG: hypothetical protein WCU88_05475 [Elusimicrobiota bacterium]|jgi:hypothetical protein